MKASGSTAHRLQRVQYAARVCWSWCRPATLPRSIMGPIDPLPFGAEPNGPLIPLLPAKSVGPPPRTVSEVRYTNAQGLRAVQGECRR